MGWSILTGAMDAKELSTLAKIAFTQLGRATFTICDHFAPGRSAGALRARASFMGSRTIGCTMDFAALLTTEGLYC